MSANIIRVSGDYKIQAVQGGNISLDAGNTGTVNIVGNLNISGNYTSITTTNTNITDNVIFLNVGQTGNGVLTGTGERISGIEIVRGSLSNAQLLFDESLTFDDPVTSTTKSGVFVFKTENGSINGIRTNSIDTNGGTLNLINSGTGVISVKGTANYENYVTDDDHIPNKKYLTDYVDFKTGVTSKLVITQPAHTATLTIDDYKIFRVENTLTLIGTDASTISFGTGGTVTYTSNKLSVFSATSSSELAGIISDETGTGLLVFNNSPTIAGHPTVEGVTSTGATGTGKFVFDGSPTLVTPTLGAATATTINKLNITTPASGSTLTIDNGKTLRISNTLTFTGTDTSSVEFSTGGTVTYTSNKLNVFSVTSSSELAGIISDETGTGLLVFNNSPTISGHPTVEGVTSTGATGTGKFVFDNAPTISGHPTIEGVTSTGATGTGNLVFSAGTTFTGTTAIATLNLTNALGIAYGGTNQTSYTSPSSSINPIVYYDGTRLQTNTLAADIGYNSSTDNFFTRNITTVSLSAQSSNGGSLLQIQADPGAAMISGNRLGGIFFGGSTNNAHTIQNRVSIESFATQSWTVSNQGAKILFSTTPNNTNSRVTALTLDQDQLAVFAGHLTVEGVTSTGATGTGKFVFDGSPTLVTPVLGVATATTINKVTITAPATGSTLTIIDGKTLTASNTLTFTGTDGSTVAFSTGGTVTYTSNKLSAFSSTSSSELAGVINDETGTGLLVFNNSPTIAGHPTIEGVTSTGATGTGKFVFDNAPTISGHPTIEGVTSTGATGTGKFVFDNAPTITGHPTIEGITSTGATGTGKFVFDNAPTITGHPTIEGITSTGATGTGKFVFDGSPTLVTPNIGAATATSINGLTISTSTGTLTIANSKIVTVNNTLTFTGTDTSSVDFGVGGTVTYTRNKLSVFSATSSSELAGVISDETGTGLLVFGTSPTISTSIITDSTSFNLINTTATTVNFAGAATTISVGATTGKITINSTDNSTSKTSGALVVSGGVGVANDLYLGGNATLLYQATDPTANSGGVKVYSKNSNLGNTGIYYVNSTTSGELVSKKKALAYSIVFG
jgi:hypothetical protein